MWQNICNLCIPAKETVEITSTINALLLVMSVAVKSLPKIV